ncbi:auxin response factor 18-like [Chenopodium quinoa]|uniref:Auxin response factor n=1 Tax=Chenopodium quinoa TaxID=63459 RepID=A0A803N3J1_CHEQI|nr:auxin response factor 18-like [Chenopodium quinoa]
MITFMDPKEKIKEADNCLDSQLWHACAGGMVQMPPVNAKIYYFVQGHIEHANGNVDFRSFPRIPSYVLCRVEDIRYLADQETDEVYAKIRLNPVTNEVDYSDEDVGVHGAEVQENKPASFAKTLTQSDANNGGGFSVPRYCAETIFPRLDYSADPPVQNILAKDVHGEPWKFRHIYRGTPRRHLLTTGWSTFVNAKKLIAGDSIVFLRAENGDLCVGIRRAKRGLGGGLDSTSGWNPGSTVLNYGAFSAFLREDENRISRNGNGVGLNSGSNASGKGKVKMESVIEAATYAAKGQPFEVVYYPRAGTPEFVVKAGHVKAALQIRWCSGMRFKMPFETEDSSRISWFMGTISSVQVADPMHWSDSPWRLLQVTWDEPDLLQNVKRVSPWLVELVSNMPAIHLSPFSPPRKKFRLPHHPDFPMDGQLPVPSFPGNFLGPSNPFGCLPDNSPAGMQGARHAQFGLSLSDLHMSKLQSGLFPGGFPALDPTTTLPNRPSSSLTYQKPGSNENISCLLTMGNSNQSIKKSDVTKPHHFVLFGKPILTEQQMSLSRSGDTVSPVPTGNSSSEGNVDKAGNVSDGSGSGHNQDRSSMEQLPWIKDNRADMDSELETGHCKVFMESEDVGRTLELTLLKSYEELCSRLANMFCIESSDMLNRVVYRDGAGSSKQLGDEPFSEFAKRAKRLTILMDSSSDNLGA